MDTRDRQRSERHGPRSIDAHAMNIVRIAISLFIAVLIAISAIGWIWTGRHQPASQARASRVVLTLSALAGLGGLAALWRPGRP